MVMSILRYTRSLQCRLSWRSVLDKADGAMDRSGTMAPAARSIGKTAIAVA